MENTAHFEKVRHWFDNATGPDLRAYDNEYGYMLAALYINDRLQANHGDLVLEIGCGDGRIMRKLAELRPDLRLVGTDISTELLARARDNNAGADFFYCNAAQEIPTKRTFDRIFSFSTAQYFSHTDLLAMLLHCQKLLRSSGTMSHCAIPDSAKWLVHAMNRYCEDGHTLQFCQRIFAGPSIYNSNDGSYWHHARDLKNSLAGALPSANIAIVRPSINSFRFDLVLTLS